MKRITALAILLLFAVSANAAPRKHFYQYKKYWVGLAIIGASIAADGAETRHVTNLYPHLGDSGVLYGNPPYSTGVIARNGAIEFIVMGGLHTIACAIECGDPSKGWSTAAGYVMPAITTATSMYGVANNAHIEARCKAAKLICD